tara:strand:+ start:2248 stop:2415 length:168 start_codon:yes stop_codon:yes gene_type:complete
MVLKTSPLSIQNKDIKDLDCISKKFPSLDNLNNEYNHARKKTKTVHRRRDLDSLG